MNTTLDPKPTDREREMLAEWAIRFCTMQHELNHPECTLSECFDFVETMLTEFRNRYGVTGAEVEAINTLPKMKSSVQENEWHFDFDLLKRIRRLACGIEPGISEEDVDAVLSVFYRICGVNNQSKNQTTEPAPTRDPDDITLKELCAMIEDGWCIQIEFDHTGMIYGDVGYGTEFNSIPDLLAILKGGNNG